jgi:hypothetical protein
VHADVAEVVTKEAFQLGARGGIERTASGATSKANCGSAL